MSENFTPEEIADQLRLAREKLNARMRLLNHSSVRPRPPPVPSNQPPQNPSKVPMQAPLSYGVRPSSARPLTLGGISNSDLQRKIKEAQKLVSSLHNKTTTDSQYPPSDVKITGGLNMQIHPLLAQANANLDREAIANMIPKSAFATSKANQKHAAATAAAAAAKTAAAKPAPVEVKPKERNDPTRNPYFDPDLGMKYIAPKPRPSKPLQFSEQGKWIEMGNQIRAEKMVEQLRQQIAERAKAAGMEEELELVSDRVLKKEPPPEVEWWDRDFFVKPVLGQEQIYDYNQLSFDEVSGITAYIQHPIPIRPPFERNKVVVKPLMLTKKERKKLRRQRRAELLKEKQEKIRLGLLPPEQAKVKLSNLMRVLGNEAVQDPTQIEAQVRQQVADRKRAHEQQNAERKLTEDERRDKKRRKQTEDVKQHGLMALVFKVRFLNTPQIKFKVEKNASQLALSGIGIINGSFCLVVVEGGPKSIKDYKKLMMRRIQWDTDTQENGNKEGSEYLANYCHLAWEGEIHSRSFKGFAFRQCPSELLVRQTLGKSKSEHYWELAKAIKEDLMAVDKVII